MMMQTSLSQLVTHPKNLLHWGVFVRDLLDNTSYQQIRAELQRRSTDLLLFEIDGARLKRRCKPIHEHLAWKKSKKKSRVSTLRHNLFTDLSIKIN
jgi:hypothetical protein